MAHNKIKTWDILYSTECPSDRECTLFAGPPDGTGSNSA